MPTRATASDRCSGSDQGSKVAPSTVGASAAPRAKIFSTPTALRVSISGFCKCGHEFRRSWTYPACRARAPVETGSSGLFVSHAAGVGGRGLRGDRGPGRGDRSTARIRSSSSTMSNCVPTGPSCQPLDPQRGSATGCHTTAKTPNCPPQHCSTKLNKHDRNTDRSELSSSPPTRTQRNHPSPPASSVRSAPDCRSGRRAGSSACLAPSCQA